MNNTFPVEEKIQIVLPIGQIGNAGAVVGREEIRHNTGIEVGCS